MPGSPAGSQTFLATLARIPTSDFLANFALARKRDPYHKARASKLARKTNLKLAKNQIWDPDGLAADPRRHPNLLWLWL